jgi:hypothetical protein
VKKGFFESAKIDSANTIIKLQPMLFYTQLMKIQPIMLSAFSIKSVFYNKIGGIDKHLDVIGSEDSHLTLRASANAKEIAFIPFNLVTLGRGDDNVSGDYLRNLEGGLLIMEDILQRGLIPSILEKYTRRSIKNQRLEIALQYYWQRDLVAAREVIVHAFKNNELKIKYITLWMKLTIRQILKV